MALGRIPGVLGLGDGYGCVYLQGTLTFDPFGDGYDTQTRGPWGTNGDIGSMLADAVKVISQADKDELRHLQEVYGVVSKHHSRPYYHPLDAKKKRADHVENYLKDRDEYIGLDFATFKAAALAELDADKEKLRRFIEPPVVNRPKHSAIWKDAQTVFYCWVRKGILKSAPALTSAGGEELSVPQVIMSGETEELKQALASVRAAYTSKFKSGGFNARPQKHGGKYMLGTISDHGLGKAVDVEDAKNAQIVSATWKQILLFTEKSLDQSSRKSKWKSNPKVLYDDIKAINDLFVTRLAKAMDDAQKAADKAAAAAKAVADAKAAADAAAAAKAPKAGVPKAAEKKPAAKKVEKAAPKKDSLDLAIEANATLKAIGKPFLKQWQAGFFSLEWNLVKAFNDNCFTWGAVFSDVDLHHFQL